MARPRRHRRRVCIDWSRWAAPGEGFSRIRVTCMMSFNTADSYWQYTFVSGGINRDRWLIQPIQCLRKKFSMMIDHWMNSLGAQIAKIATKMIARRRSRSNSSCMHYCISPDKCARHRSRKNEPLILSNWQLESLSTYATSPKGFIQIDRVVTKFCLIRVKSRGTRYSSRQIYLLKYGTPWR